MTTLASLTNPDTLHVIEPIGADSAGRVFSTLTVAFAADPPVRWMYPAADQYLAHFRKFIAALGEAALRERTAYGAVGGAALWLQPATEPDEQALVELVENTVAADRQADVFALFEAMAGYHPGEFHWYLPLIGVEPAWQGLGVGASLMRPALDICDATRVPAYLEATSPRSTQLYRRLGFRQTGVIRVADCPPIFPMVRPPANGGRT